MSKKNPYGNSIEDFEILERIGYGGFAEVFKARCRAEFYQDTYVAIKRISKKCACDRKCKKECICQGRFKDRIENEINIHSQLPTFTTFVQFYGTFEDEKYRYLILELCTDGSLEEYIKNAKKGKDLSKECCLPEKEAMELIKQVIAGVRYLHAMLIIHRDLSLRNLLLTDRRQVKIADFGLSVKLKNYDQKTNTVLGTPNFMPPEIYNHDSYDYKADCWSIGIVLYALLYGSLPFNHGSRKDIMRNVQNSELRFPPYASKEAKKLLKSLLNKDPEKRVTLKDALTYNFFKQHEKSGNKNEISYQKRCGDSGMNSSSGFQSKKSQSNHTSAESNYSSNYPRSDKRRKNKSIKNSPVTTRQYDRKYDQSPDIHQDSQNSPSPISHMKNKFPTLPPRFESQYNTFIKSNLECPSVQADLRLLERNTNTQSYSDYGSCNYKGHSVNHCNILKHCDTYPQRSYDKNDVDSGLKESLCSHDQYCTPDSNCIHKSSCCCHQTKHGSCTPLSVESIFGKILNPLNTKRIEFPRKELKGKNTFISIVKNGPVWLECFKLKKGEKYVNLVYLISDDGLEITIYKPKKKILFNPDQPPPIPYNEHEVEKFTLTDLPPKYWKIYKLAKLVVDVKRASTPKITYHNEENRFTFIMMENSPNNYYEMNFWDGFQITEIKRKKKFKDKNGCHIDEKDVSNSILEMFEEMKQKCKKIEYFIEKNLDSSFPAEFGKKPFGNKRNIKQDFNNKENLPPNSSQSPSLNGLNSNVKQCEITIGTENSLFQNIYQNSSLIPYSNEKSISSRNTTDSISHLKNLKVKQCEINVGSETSLFQNIYQRSSLIPYSNEKSTSYKSTTNSLSDLKNLKVEKEMVIAEYKDGVKMYISIKEDTNFFKDANNQIIIPSKENPQFMERFENDSREILRRALLKEMESVT